MIITLNQSLNFIDYEGNIKKRKPESIRAIARNPKTNSQPTRINSESDTHHRIPTQQFQELLAKMDTMQRQSIDQNLGKFAEKALGTQTFTNKVTVDNLKNLKIIFTSTSKNIFRNLQLHISLRSIFLNFFTSTKKNIY